MFRCKHEANGWQPFATVVSLHRMITAVRGPLTSDLWLPSRFSVNFFNFHCSLVHIPAVEKQDVATPDGA